MQQDVEERARQQLAAPWRFEGLVPRSEHDQLLRVWVHPATAAYVSWSVFRDGERRFVRRVIWDRTRHPIEGPHLHASEVLFPAPRVRRLREELAALVLPPFAGPSSVGIDGTVRGVHAGSLWGAATLTWWEDPPTGWSGLAAWHARAVEGFDEVLPATTAPR